MSMPFQFGDWDIAGYVRTVMWTAGEPTPVMWKMGEIYADTKQAGLPFRLTEPVYALLPENDPRHGHNGRAAWAEAAISKAQRIRDSHPAMSGRQRDWLERDDRLQIEARFADNGRSVLFWARDWSGKGKKRNFGLTEHCHQHLSRMAAFYGPDVHFQVRDLLGDEHARTQGFWGPQGQSIAQLRKDGLCVDLKGNQLQVLDLVPIQSSAANEVYWLRPAGAGADEHSGDDPRICAGACIAKSDRAVKLVFANTTHGHEVDNTFKLAPAALAALDEATDHGRKSVLLQDASTGRSLTQTPVSLAEIAEKGVYVRLLQGETRVIRVVPAA
jgi:hypothetical protein